MASLSLDEAAQLYDTLRHFFEVAVHAVLYYRRLYPERAFAAATAFGVPVHQCRHPAVCAWVRAAVDHMLQQLAGGTGAAVADRVNAVAVVVHAPFASSATPDRQDDAQLPRGAVLERWVFDVRHLPQRWPGGIEALQRAQRDHAKHERSTAGGGGRREKQRQRQRQKQQEEVHQDGDDRYTYYDEEEELANADSEAELDNLASDGDGDGGDRGGDDNADRAEGATSGKGRSLDWADLHHQLRGVVQRLAQAGQQLAALPAAGCTFTMAIELSDGEAGGSGDAAELPPGQMAGVQRSMDASWIPATDEHRREFGGGDDGGGGGANSTTTTIRTVDSAPLFLECWVEESAVKRAASDGRSARLASSVGDGDIMPPPPPLPGAAAPSAASTASYSGGLGTSFALGPSPESPALARPPNKGKSVTFH